MQPSERFYARRRQAAGTRRCHRAHIPEARVQRNDDANDCFGGGSSKETLSRHRSRKQALFAQLNSARAAAIAGPQSAIARGDEKPEMALTELDMGPDALWRTRRCSCCASRLPRPIAPRSGARPLWSWPWHDAETADKLSQFGDARGQLRRPDPKRAAKLFRGRHVVRGCVGLTQVLCVKSDVARATRYVDKLHRFAVHGCECGPARTTVWPYNHWYRLERVNDGSWQPRGVGRMAFVLRETPSPVLRAMALLLMLAPIGSTTGKRRQLRLASKLICCAPRVMFIDQNQAMQDCIVRRDRRRRF